MGVDVLFLYDILIIIPPQGGKTIFGGGGGGGGGNSHKPCISKSAMLYMYDPIFIYRYFLSMTIIHPPFSLKLIDSSRFINMHAPPSATYWLITACT